jgi:hypothetical protein
MKTKPLIILAVLLLALLGLKYMQSSRHDTRLARSSMELLFPDLAPDQFGSLSITGADGVELILERVGEGWIMPTSYGHAAAADKVERVLGELAGLMGDFRSEGKAVLADYALDEKQTIHLRARDLAGAELGHLLLGNSLTGGSGFFVRRAGEDTAYAARGNLLGSLGIWGEKRELAAKSFLDLKAFELDRQQVDRLRIIDADGELELSKVFAAPPADTVAVDRSQYVWRSGALTLDKAKTDGVLGALASIHAQNLLDPAGDYGFGDDPRRVELQLADGASRVIEFGAVVAEPAAGVAMRVYGDEAVYLVYERMPDRIFKEREELLPEAG